MANPDPQDAVTALQHAIRSAGAKTRDFRRGVFLTLFVGGFALCALVMLPLLLLPAERQAERPEAFNSPWLAVAGALFPLAVLLAPPLAAGYRARQRRQLQARFARLTPPERERVLQPLAADDTDAGLLVRALRRHLPPELAPAEPQTAGRGELAPSPDGFPKPD